MSIKDFIQMFSRTVKNYIEKYETYKELTGEEKKARVDNVVTIYTEQTFNALKINFILRLILKKLIIDNIPTITQVIFDLIKTKIDGITE